MKGHICLDVELSLKDRETTVHLFSLSGTSVFNCWNICVVLMGHLYFTVGTFVCYLEDICSLLVGHLFSPFGTSVSHCMTSESASRTSSERLP